MILGNLGCVGAGTVCDSYPLRHSRDNSRSNLHQFILNIEILLNKSFMSMLIVFALEFV